MTLGEYIIIGLLGVLIYKTFTMANELDNLETEVQENNDAVQSAITLLNGLKAALDAAIASGDMTRVQALSDTLSSQTDALAAAVTANTPSAPTE